VAGSQTSDDVRTLVEISRQLASTTDLQRLLDNLGEAALSALDCERVTVFLYDDATKELWSTVATGSGEIRFSIDRGIAGEVATSLELSNVPDAYADPRFNPEIDRTTGFKTRSILTLPMTGAAGNLVGVLQLLNKRGGSFDVHDSELAQALAAIAGVAVQRQRLFDEFAVKQRLLRDLDVAREIQRGYLPERDPDVPGFDVAGWAQPADHTGGDAFDFVELEDGKLGLLVADATGHGIGPALIVAECRVMVRVLAESSLDLVHIAERANAILCNDLASDRFVTACFAVLDPAPSIIRYFSAGHAPIIHYRAATDEMILRDAHTVPLGILDGLDLELGAPLELEPGDLFILITDGFFEWANTDGVLFGVERMCESIRNNREATCAQIIERLYDEVVAFSGGTVQADDLTAIVLKRDPAA